MRTVGLRQLYRNLGRELKNLPLLITNHNKPIAVIIEDKEYLKLIKKDE